MGTEVAARGTNDMLIQQPEASAVLSIIERAARDSTVDMDKMERLMAMHERMMAKQSEQAYAEALAAMQSDLPTIGERGAIRNKDRGVQSTYALWEDINRAILPVLKTHGFSLTFRTDTSQGIRVTGVLQHRAGHKESTEILLPADNSGSKNTVQAIASSISYGKRYTAGALLNLTSCGEDDDATSAFSGLSQVEQGNIFRLMQDTDTDEQTFCEWVSKGAFHNVASLPGDYFQPCITALNRKKDAIKNAAEAK